MIALLLTTVLFTTPPSSGARVTLSKGMWLCSRNGHQQWARPANQGPNYKTQDVQCGNVALTTNGGVTLLNMGGKPLFRLTFPAFEDPRFFINLDRTLIFSTGALAIGTWSRSHSQQIHTVNWVRHNRLLYGVRMTTGEVSWKRNELEDGVPIGTYHRDLILLKLVHPLAWMHQGNNLQFAIIYRQANNFHLEKVQYYWAHKKDTPSLLQLLFSIDSASCFVTIFNTPHAKSGYKLAGGLTLLVKDCG